MLYLRCLRGMWIPSGVPLRTPAHKNTSQLMQEAALASLVDAVTTNNASQVARLLDHENQRSLSCRETLLPSSAKAQALLRLLSDNYPNNPDPQRNILIRACLMSPSAYDLPWKVALQGIRTLHADPQAMILPDIRMFLQHNIVQWHDYDRLLTSGTNKARKLRRNSGPEPVDCLLQWVEAILEPLRISPGTNVDDDEILDARGKDSDRCGSESLEVASSIVVMARDLDQELHEQALERIFDSDERIRPPGILSWITLAVELREHLREQELHVVLALTRAALPSVPASDWPGIAQSVLLMSIHVDSGSLSRSIMTQLWIQLLVAALECAATDLVAYSTVDTLLYDTMIAFSTNTRRKFAASLSKEMRVPKYILLNLWLLVWRSHRDSGAQRVAKVLARALGNKHKQEMNLNRFVVDQFVRIMGLPKHGLELRGYMGRGRFKRDDLATAGEAIYQSLFFQPIGDASLMQIQVLERAQAMVQLAELAQEQACASAEAAVVLVTVYCEIPRLRPSLVQLFVQIFEKRDVDQDRAFLYCDILGVVTATKHHGDELGFVANLLAKELPKTVYMRLSSALLPFSGTRDILLSFADGFLVQGSCLAWSARDTHGMFESCIHSLSLLTLYDIFSVKAWSMLSSLIVSGNPAVPKPVRSFLFGFLAGKTEDLAPEVLDRILRICLLRLLMFVEFDYSGIERISVEKREGQQQDEDLPGLVQLVFLLNERRTHKSRSAENMVIACFREALRVMIDDALSTGVEQRRPAIMPSSGVDSLTTTWVYVILSLLNEVRATAARVRLSCFARKEGLEEALLRDEKSLYDESPEEKPLFTESKSANVIPDDDDDMNDPEGNVFIDTSGNAALQCQLLDCIISWSAMFAESSSGAPMVNGGIHALFGKRRFFERQSCRMVGSSFAPEGMLAVGRVLAAETEFNLPDLLAQGDMIRIDLCLSSVKVYCDDFARSLQTSLEVRGVVGLEAATTAHRLYRLVGSEASTINLLKQLREHGAWRGAQLLQHTLSDEHALFAAARDLRTSILRFSAVSLDLASKRPSGNDDILFFSRWMEDLSKDCRAGLESQSGALTEAMLTFFVDGIAACTVLLSFQRIDQSSLLVFIQSAAKSSTQYIFDILCSYNLPHAASFKKTCRLVMSTVPRLDLQLATRWLTSHDALPDDYDRTWTSRVVDESARQCLALVDAVAGCGEKAASTWEHIVDARHLRPYDEASGEFETRNKVLQLKSFRIWSWALSATAEAIEDHWNDSLRLMETSSDESFDFESFVGFRGGRVDKTFVQLSQLFSNSVDDGEPLAFLLPVSLKSSVLSLLDCWLAALSKSVQILAKYARNVARGPSPALAEAAAVLSSWLKCQDLTRDDLLIVIRRWSLHELLALARRRDGSYAQETALTRKLPKLVLQAEVVERELQELSLISKTNEDARKPVPDWPVLQVSECETAVPLPFALEAHLERLKKQRVNIEDVDKVDDRKEKRKLSELAGKQVQKQRKRGVLRSRNRTIDAWLHQDRAFDDPDDLDAYIDLEDFLVEG